jgi:hypothetical protein
MSLTVSPTNAVEKIAATLLEAAKAIEGEAKAEQALTAANAADAAEPVHADANLTLVQGGFVERILGEPHGAVATAPAQVHAEHVDKGPETANLQTFARPHAANPEPTRQSDPTLPQDKHAHSEYAVPSALLVPTTLVSLQIDPAAAWAMQGRGFGPDLTRLHEARVEERHSAHAPVEEELPEDEEQDGAPEPVAEEQADKADSIEFADADASTWREALTRALRSALAEHGAPPALLLAAQQWKRGRCVVLACPQSADPAAAGWAFVLWPRKQPLRRAEDAPPPLSLYGVRVEARLHWGSRPGAPRWCYERVIKQHHPRTGRQLIPATAEPSGRVACEVQLGPVLARPLRSCEVCLRINAVRRFWVALGTQWSMHVVVCSHALLGHEALEENDRS